MGQSLSKYTLFAPNLPLPPPPHIFVQCRKFLFRIIKIHPLSQASNLSHKHFCTSNIESPTLLYKDKLKHFHVSCSVTDSKR
ncbi:hypothetical protein FKM82_015766 [Ascaphus truei]